MDDIIFEAVRQCDPDPISHNADSSMAHMNSFEFNSHQSTPHYSSSSELRSASTAPSQPPLTPSPASFDTVSSKLVGDKILLYSSTVGIHCSLHALSALI
ncbi:hypothetical protein Aduo_017720 [Ancylostoma duodenale]